MNNCGRKKLRYQKEKYGNKERCNKRKMQQKQSKKERRGNKIVINGLKMDTKKPTVKEGIRGLSNNNLHTNITPKTVIQAKAYV